jgi:uncharacterized membrane protein YkvI
MEKKKSGLTAAAVGIAMVWMGTHFGPGIASGTQVNVYYIQYGIPGFFAMFLAMGLLAVCLYISTEASRIYKTYEYKSWIQNIFGVKWVSYLFDLSFIVTCITAMGGSLNAVATLIQNTLGINYWIGVALVVICGALLCAYGAELVRRASSYMMFLVVGVLLLIIIMVALYGDGDLKGAFAFTNTTLDPANFSWPKAMWSAVIYAAFQATVIANIASVADTIKSRRESKTAALVGFVSNVGLLVIIGLMLFSYTSVFAITKEALPIFAILQRLNFPWMTTVYVVVVFIAVLSTVVGFAFAGVARFSVYYQPKEGERSSLRDGLFVAVLLIACAFASKFGILKLVSVGYKALGYLNLPILILSSLILGSRKISRKYLEENNIEAEGLD